MRSLVTKYAPTPLLNLLRDIRDRSQVTHLPGKTFPADNLRTATPDDLAAWLTDPAIPADWDSDHAAIRALFGDDNLMGGVNPGDRRAIYALIHALKPRSVLEVGTHIGASMLYIAHALRHGGGKVTTVDIIDVNAASGPWRGKNLPAPPRDMAAQLGCADRVTFVATPSTAYLATTTETFDFIFLDGDHSARAVYDEVAATLPRLRPGGLILLHDYYPRGEALFPDGNVIYGPFRAIDRIRRENPAIAALPLGTLPWPTKQGSSNTSLALLVNPTPSLRGAAGDAAIQGTG